MPTNITIEGKIESNLEEEEEIGIPISSSPILEAAIKKLKTEEPQQVEITPAFVSTKTSTQSTPIPNTIPNTPKLQVAEKGKEKKVELPSFFQQPFSSSQFTSSLIREKVTAAIDDDDEEDVGDAVDMEEDHDSDGSEDDIDAIFNSSKVKKQENKSNNQPSNVKKASEMKTFTTNSKPPTNTTINATSTMRPMNKVTIPSNISKPIPQPSAQSSFHSTQKTTAIMTHEHKHKKKDKKHQ